MIQKSVVGRSLAQRSRIGMTAVAGMIGPVLFVSGFTVYGWLYPGYSPTGMFVSELSLGPYGWIQILNFMLTGTLILAFGMSGG